MMTDRELLESAAKAAGVELLPMAIPPWPPNGSEGFIGYMTDPDVWPRGWFDPLTDDGDAFRLAVKLRLWIQHREDNTVNVYWYDGKGAFAGNVVEEIGSLRNGDAPCKATRRAIVRAAASIGETK